jgi:hypothetical protein
LESRKLVRHVLAVLLALGNWGHNFLVEVFIVLV